jgi:hypothetical protein
VCSDRSRATRRRCSADIRRSTRIAIVWLGRGFASTPAHYVRHGGTSSCPRMGDLTLVTDPGPGRGSLSAFRASVGHRPPGHSADGSRWRMQRVQTAHRFGREHTARQVLPSRLRNPRARTAPRPTRLPRSPAVTLEPSFSPCPFLLLRRLSIGPLPLGAGRSSWSTSLSTTSPSPITESRSNSCAARRTATGGPSAYHSGHPLPHRPPLALLPAVLRPRTTTPRDGTWRFTSRLEALLLDLAMTRLFLQVLKHIQSSGRPRKPASAGANRPILAGRT